MLLQNAWHVFQQAAARDVSQALDVRTVGSQGSQHGFHVDAGGFHDHVSQRTAIELVGRLGVGVLENLANQGVTVGVGTAGSQTQNHVTRNNGLAIDNARFFYRSHCKTGQVVLAFGVHAGHLGRLTTDQGTSGQFTTLGNAANYLSCRVDRQLAAGKVIQKVQGFCALD